MYLPVAVAAVGLSAFLGYRTYSGCRDIWKFGRENLFSLSVRPALQDIANCVLHALVECKLVNPETSEENIVITERSDGSIRVYLDGAEEDSLTFSASFAQIFSPIEDQRYAVERYESAVPGGVAGKFSYLLRMGMNRYSPVLMCYHPLPDVFNIKERALVFKKFWNRFVSPGEIVFLKGESGSRIIEKYGRVNYLDAKKMHMKVWK
jgi:hypothetical protein